MRIQAFFFCLIMLPIFIVTTLRSEVVEIHVPELQGWYSHPDSAPNINLRTATINLGKTPSYIREAWIILSADITVGLHRCPPDTLDYAWPYSFYASLDDSVTGGFWRALILLPGQSGYFQGISQLYSQQGATWEFLTNEIIEIQLYGAALSISPLCIGITPPFAFVEDAIFRIDADFVVPVSNGSWGRIKALYGDRSN